MKRLLLVLLCSALLAATLPAWDFGGYIDNTTGLENAPVGTGSAVELVQRTSVAAWLYSGFGSWTLDTQASYVYTPAVPVLADLDRLVLEGVFPAELGGARSFGVKLGRFTAQDTTGYVLNHRLDGLQLSVGRESSAFSAVVGTTAGFQKPTSAVVMSRLDVLDLSNGAVRVAPPRLITSVEYRARSLFAGQDLAIGAVVQEDLRPDAQLTSALEEDFDPQAGGALDTQYITLLLSGGLSPGLFHRTYYTVNTGRTLNYLEDAESTTGASYQYAPVFGHLAGFELSYFLPSVLNSRIRFSGLFSTGESELASDPDGASYFEGNRDAVAGAFIPISASSFSDVFTLQPGNSAHVALSYSLRPLPGSGTDILQTELSGVLYFRTAGGGPVSAGTVNAATTEAYVGTDIDLKVVVQPFSDLRVVAAGGVFVPNAAVMTSGNEGASYQATLQGILRF